MKDSDRPPVLAHERFAANRAAFDQLGLAARFARIEADNVWGAATSVSGLGRARGNVGVARDAARVAGHGGWRDKSLGLWRLADLFA